MIGEVPFVFFSGFLMSLVWFHLHVSLQMQDGIDGHGCSFIDCQTCQRTRKVKTVRWTHWHKVALRLNNELNFLPQITVLWTVTHYLLLICSFVSRWHLAKSKPWPPQFHHASRILDKTLLLLLFSLVFKADVALCVQQHIAHSFFKGVMQPNVT